VKNAEKPAAFRAKRRENRVLFKPDAKVKVCTVLRPQFKMSTKGPEINSEGGVHVDLETTGNGQKEPAFDTFCVGGTKK
jgi:hypothetical protein